MTAPRLLTALPLVFMLHLIAGDLVPGIQFAAAAQTVQFTEESFDKVNFDQLTIAAARNKCVDLMSAMLALVDKAAELTDQQKNKLQLAGEADIHRFFFDYAKSKQGLKFGALPRDQWMEQMAAAQKAALPHKTRFSEGLHGESSLFQKTMETTLDADQYRSVQALFDERKRSRYTYYIQATLEFIDHKLPLTAHQRTTISELLMTKTSPPNLYGASSTPLLMVLSRMGKIEDDLEELFPDKEMGVLRQLIQAGTVATNRIELQ